MFPRARHKRRACEHRKTCGTGTVGLAHRPYHAVVVPTAAGGGILLGGLWRGRLGVGVYLAVVGALLFAARRPALCLVGLPSGGVLAADSQLAVLGGLGDGVDIAMSGVGRAGLVVGIGIGRDRQVHAQFRLVGGQ